MVKVSLCIPIHDTPKTAFFLSRLLNSVAQQTFTDYEICITKEGPFAHNHNAAVQKAKGEIVQMLQMDDYLADENSLARICYSFTPETRWVISASLHDSNGQVGWPHTPQWTDDIYTGTNRLGSVSTLAMRREDALLFEEPLTWMVDCDLYYRLYLKYGPPKICTTPNVVIDTRNDRLSHTLTDELKQQEISYLKSKYDRKH